MPLQWRHNERDGVSNHQPQGCLLNRLFRHRWKKTPKLRVTGLCEGNSPVTGEFPTQRASNAENVSIWWRHRVMACCRLAAKPLPKRMLTHCQLSAWKQNSLKFESKYKYCYWCNCVWKYGLQNVGHFVLAFVCRTMIGCVLRIKPLTHWGQDKTASTLAGDIFKCNFVNENVLISIKTSLKLVRKGSIDNKSSLFQLMVWCHSGDKPLPEPIMLPFNDAYMRHLASMS